MTKPLQTPDEVATERFNLISPLLSDDLDKGRRYDLMHDISESKDISERTLRRYVAAWHAGGYEALKPKRGWERLDSRLGDGFEQIVEAAVALRRESPSRSVADIIKILELEGAVEAGAVSRSTLQRHLAAKGYSTSQMRMYTATGAAARRFRKEHRNQLWQTDVKYAAFIPDGKGRKKQCYLVAWVDDATSFVVSAAFYFDQTVDAIEDSLRKGIQSFGIPDKIFTDNGPQYRSKWLSGTCAKLGIRLLHSRPYHPEGKGLIENFNKQVNKLLSEAALMKPSGLAEYNELLRVWIDEYYHKHLNSGLSGVSPATAYGTDKRPLKFASAGQLRDAFLHIETRKVDKTGCVSFEGRLYEVGLAYIGRKVEIRFDPSWKDELEIVHEQAAPFIAKKLVIGSNCGAVRALPEHMRTDPPETSRMLEALKKEHEANRRTSEFANSYKDFWEGGQKDV